MIHLPDLPDLGLLADLCTEAAAAERVQPFMVEKDFYLTHLIWTLSYESSFGPQSIAIEVAMRPALRDPRRVPLNQLL
jgi:hypothetical protein